MISQINDIWIGIDSLKTMLKYMWDHGVDPKEAWNKLNNQRGSIAREASKSIYEYPILASDTCSYDLTRAVTNSIQARSAVYTKIVFERIGLVDLSKGESKSDMIHNLKGFHMDVEELGESAKATPGTMSLMREAGQFNKSDSGLNMGMIEGKVLTEATEKTTSRKYRVGTAPDGSRTEHEVEMNVTSSPKKSKMGDQYDPTNLTDKQFDDYQNRREYETKRTHNTETEIKRNIVKGQPFIGKTIATLGKDSRRANPTTIEIELEYKTVEHVSTTRFTVGVRAVLHPIPSDEIIKFIPKAKFDMSPLIRLAQLTTGEISFVKDFVLGVDNIHKDMHNPTAGKGKWYAKLKELTRTNNAAKVIPLATGKMPTATLLVSMEDVDEMLRLTKGKFDLREPGIAKMVVESLSLMNLIIVDEATDRLWWYEDTHTGYALYSVSDLDEANKGLSEKDLLKVMVAVNK